MDILEKARKILLQPVCDSCLGRQFAQLLSGYTNEERGKIIRTLAAMSIDKEKFDTKDFDMSNFIAYKFHNLEIKVSPKKNICAICSGLFSNLEKWRDKVVNKSRKYEFSSFLIGTKLSFELITKEEELWERVGIDYCEPIKAEINREIGKLIERKIKVKFNPKNPQVNFIIDFGSGKVNAEINPLFIYGEYQKLIRGIPQTRWPSGKYKTSVEQIIAKPFMIATKGKGHKLHGCVSGDTKVLLDECSLPISQLENAWKDHNVITFNEKDKKIETSKIEDFMKIKLETFRLRTKETGREIIASKEHPFYTTSGMLPLASLKSGDLVAVNSVEPIFKSKIFKELKDKGLALSQTENIKVPNDFPYLVWETIESIEKAGEAVVYDLTVPKNHNFFANGFLVSNCGREDIDARCLGWRPFVLEIVKPSYRNINLNKLAKKIGKGVRTRKLRFSSIAEVRKIKEAKLDKSYRCIVACDKKISSRELKKLSTLVGTINQRTPQRVLHRRSDRKRIKKLKAIKTKLITGKKFLLTAKCEAGLYIKELVSGDNGRTRPSIAEVLHCNCIAKDLDVINIHKK